MCMFYNNILVKLGFIITFHNNILPRASVFLSCKVYEPAVSL